MKTGKKLRDANPEGFRKIVARAIEAQGRGLWNADEEKLEKLRELYDVTHSLIGEDREKRSSEPDARS